MKIAHTLFHTPHKSGLYETTREIAAAERAAGHDSRMVDPMTDVYLKDRGVPYARRVWMLGADIIVNHGGLGNIPRKHPPILAIFHGTPNYCFIMTQYHGIDLWTNPLDMAGSPRVSAIITFSERHIHTWSLLGRREKFHVIPPPVDLEYWSPNGAGYDYDSHTTNLVVTDRWRPSKDSFDILIGVALYAERHPNTRVHLYGAPDPPNGALTSILKALRARDVLGQVRGDVEAQDLRAIYRAADLVLTTDRGTARTIREAMACGCPVLSGMGDNRGCASCDMARPSTVAMSIDSILGGPEDRQQRRRRARSAAKREFDPRNTVKALEGLYRHVIEG